MSPKTNDTSNTSELTVKSNSPLADGVSGNKAAIKSFNDNTSTSAKILTTFAGGATCGIKRPSNIINVPDYGTSNNYGLSINTASNSRAALESQLTAENTLSNTTGANEWNSSSSTTSGGGPHSKTLKRKTSKNKKRHAKKTKKSKTSKKSKKIIKKRKYKRNKSSKKYMKKGCFS